MEFPVRLYIRTHHQGTSTVEVIGESKLTVYTDDLERAREELTLVLTDRFERMNPGRLGGAVEAELLEHHVVEVPDALVIDTVDGPAPRKTKVSLLVATDRQWHRLFLPRWSLRAWVPRHRDPLEAAVELAATHLGQQDEPARLRMRYEGEERLETLVVDAEPSLPLSFTGKFAGRDFLPEPAPPPEKTADEDEGEGGDRDAADGKRPRKKKKRPPTPTLKQIGVALHRQAKDDDLERAHGRAREVTELLGLVADPGACVVAVGDAGVGKTTVLNELVYRLRDPHAPEAQRTRPIFFVDASRLIAGQGFFGDWQKQVIDAVQECIDAEVVWYIGDLLALLDAGKSAQSEQNVAQLLKPYLAGRRLTVVAEATTRAWARVELRDASFARLFTPYRLEEPPRAGVRAILDAVAAELADETGIAVRPDGIQAVDDLCGRFRGDGSRLGQSVHFLRRLVDDAALAVEQAEDDAPLPILDRHAVVGRFCAETGLPPFLVRDDMPLDTEAVRRHFEQRIIGQPEAIERMADLVALMKAGLSDQGRPLGSFLFVGPTGVGKTEMSKALAEFLFGRRDRLIRFDMSEFVSPESVHRFIGTAGEEGQLISLIRRQPFCVLLLDEIEKAHPAVFDVLLQVIGEARLSDQSGRTADFRNTVVLMTSNLGVSTFKRGAGFGQPGARDFRAHFLAEAERFFRPEFFNRIDHIVPFMPLGAEAIDRITGRALAEFLDREGLRQRDLSVELPPEVHQWIATRGVDPRYGARPLKRLIESALTAPLARYLAGRQVGSGQGVAVSAGDESLLFGSTERKSARTRVAARTTMRAFLGEVGVLRTQIQQWLDSSLFRETVQSIRLLDRLARDRNFWADRARAEARMRHSQADRDLIAGLQAVQAQVAGIEDLAYEGWHARTSDALEMLQLEYAEAIEQLEAAELQLVARQYPAPDHSILMLHASADGGPLLSELIEIYAWLALHHGWRMTGRVAAETRLARDVRAGKADPPGSGGKKRRKSGDDDDKASKSRSRARQFDADWAWTWGQQHTLAQRDEDDEAARRKAVRRFVDQLTSAEPERVRALIIEGKHVTGWLAHESGLHVRTGESGGRVPLVKVSSLSPAARRTPNPVWALKNAPRKRRRRFDSSRRLIVDEVMSLALPIEPRRWRLYGRMMRAAMYDAVFGPGAWRLFARKGADDRRGGA